MPPERTHAFRPRTARCDQPDMLAGALTNWFTDVSHLDLSIPTFWQSSIRERILTSSRRRQPKKIKRRPKKAERPIVAAGINLDLKVEFVIEVGIVKEKMIAYIISSAPADILLGHPFLVKHSPGYRAMLKEFPDARIPQNRSVVCTVLLQEKLERLLDNYSELILKKDELPPPNRYYKGQTFELGIPDEARDKIFFKAQYPPKAHQIDDFRKVIQPLKEAGIYVESNSPHNNPVMLVPKKNPGEYRMVVDSREVNKVCKPVGGMSGSTVDLVRMFGEAKIFTTLDLKNAFYCLPLDEKDRQYTKINVPGDGPLECTRMPMGAKASMAALHRV